MHLITTKVGYINWQNRFQWLIEKAALLSDVLFSKLISKQSVRYDEAITTSTLGM